MRDENSDNTCDDGPIYHLSDAISDVTSIVDTAGDALECHVYRPHRADDLRRHLAGIRSAFGHDIKKYTYSGERCGKKVGVPYHRQRQMSIDFANRPAHTLDALLFLPWPGCLIHVALAVGWRLVGWTGGRAEHLSTLINTYQHLSTLINTYQHLSTLIQIHQSSEDRDDPSEYVCPVHSATKLATYPQV